MFCGWTNGEDKVVKQFSELFFIKKLSAHCKMWLTLLQIFFLYPLNDFRGQTDHADKVPPKIPSRLRHF